MKNIISLLFLLTITFSLQAQHQDTSGSSDYDLFDRMLNYYILNYWDYQFDAHEFLISKNEKKVVEGRKIIIRYEHQNAFDKTIKKPSYLQILRNYSNAIKKVGGDILFEHKTANYGHYILKTMKGKEIWLEVKTAPDNGRRYTLTIIEKELMTQDIVIEADLIKEKLKTEGRIAIYGIYFDTGKSLIKPESKESLFQIALFLKANPNISCWVVGHTDSDGPFVLNNKLSLSRAKAIVSYLQNKHSISPNRLFAQGVGPLSPISTNETEAGKKLNRRVEFVKKTI